MTGSGNDFVMFDARDEPPGALETPAVIQAVCARGTGVGADGVVFLEPPTRAGTHFRMRYFNRDGSCGAACGNATLCITRLAAILGAAPAEEMRIESDTGILHTRLVAQHPEVELQPVHRVSPSVEIAREPQERRAGFALAGVPHLVVLCDDVERIDVAHRGAQLRRDAVLGEDGANVDFVSPRPTERGAGWSMRTYERGVEAETLACGTGAIATAVLLSTWDESTTSTTMETRSGRELRVTLRQCAEGWLPSLSGEGRLVYTGELHDAG
ncbi:MAG TPA: diaminopimelate epimerase [Gemmatimonadaceae bacterium]|nr:diaminopimelate epimerase [Gemmatimonadaceae bacterium]